ncbi:MAG TPA: APC family permease [Solirubrobacteraceae bacterium]|jgi:amino acid transporter|nr:APC family permease [Solirubrobacteraceae bacterium]
MATESIAAGAAPPPSGVMDKGLKKNAIGYLSNLVIGVASTAPAYSLAATLGAIVAVSGVGVHAPAVLLVSFVPMLLIAAAYKYLNRADPDAGTTFAWTTRALGPGTGWVNGWAIFLADVIVMASLAQIASVYTFKLFDWESAASSQGAIIAGAVIWIALMTWICYRGIELSARIQQFLLGAEILILGLFAVVALAKVYGGHPAHSIHPSLSWFNPFAMKFGDLVVGLLLGIFIYWGWDSGVAVNEESEDPNEGPGRAAVMSTIVLVVIYVVVSAAAQAFHGTSFLSENESDVLSALGKPVLGGVLYKLLIVAVLTSASASTQTTILPTARTTLSMAHWKAVAALLGRVHKRYLTPTVSTLGMGAVSIAFTVVILLLSEHVLTDSITAIGFPICFYYGFTGLACAVYYRHELLKSTRHFVLLGLAPFLGWVMFLGIGVYAAIHYGHAANVESKPILGITLPLWFGVGGLVLGIVLMIASRFFFRDYFARKLETAPVGLIDEPVEHAPAHF